MSLETYTRMLMDVSPEFPMHFLKIYMYVSYAKAHATAPQVVAFRDWLLEAGRASPGADGLVRK